jgi:hypothetical protein
LLWQGTAVPESALQLLWFRRLKPSTGQVKPMLKSVYSVSDDLDPMAGARQIVAECQEKLEGQAPQAGIFFTSCMDVDYASMLGIIKQAFPSIELIGCTTDGEITPDRGFTEDSSALLLLCSETIAFAAAVAEHISSDGNDSVAKACREASAKLSAAPAAALVLPDGISTMDTPIDELLRSSISESLPIFGGSAGDAFRLEQTYQFYDGRVYTDSMPMLLFGGDLAIVVDVATGPLPYGDYFEVNRAEGNVIHSIDGVTALEFYERFYGKYIEDRELSFFPLAVYFDESGDFVLRDSVEVNRENGSISFVGRLEFPCRVRLTQVSREETLSSGHRGSERVLTSFGQEEPDLVMLFSCTSRRHVLGSRTDEEFDVLRRDSREVPFFGFYCYGEIGPFGVGRPVKFHSDTFVSVALRCKRNNS